MAEDWNPQKGFFTEIVGARSSGKTGMLMEYLEQATGNKEFAAVVDSTDSFDPTSAEKAGVDLDRILWVRCSENLDIAFKSTDYILHGGGFGLVVLDIGDVRPEIANRIPHSYWFRFRLAVENTRTAFLLISPIPCCGSSCSLSLQCTAEKSEWTGSPGHKLLTDLHCRYAVRKKSAMLLAGPEKPGIRVYKKSLFSGIEK